MQNLTWYRYIVPNLIKREWGDRFIPLLNRWGINSIRYSFNSINHCAGKKVMSIQETNQLIYDKILSGTPFMVGRFGGTELSVITSELRAKKFPYIDRREYYLNRICTLSGFFPYSREEESKFVQLMLECCQDIDLCGVWRLFMEDYVLKQYAPQAKITKLLQLEPWNLLLYGKEGKILPWSAALEGKKVLVIHPFAESIAYQYENNRKKIFSNICCDDSMLPEFELKIIKAVQTINRNEQKKYANWFEALNYMVEQCKNIDFDIAIIGCGAYGFPLAAKIKQMGKGAIHLGGATQLMFGIRGKRWETEEVYTEFAEKVMNESWIRPFECERPIEADKVENGCYW